MPVNLQENIRSNFRQLGQNMRDLGSSLRDTVQKNVIIENLKDLQSAVTANVKDFGENIRNNYENSRNHNFQNKGATKRWSKQYDYGAIFEIHSVQKLLDIIERRYSYVSITLLLVSTGFESTAVAFFLKAQYQTRLTDWRAFEWGLPNFIILSVLSIFFAISWFALLSSAVNKVAYVFKLTSIMTYLTSFWMLFLAAAAIVTQNGDWTRVYAPVFFRFWWLHQCLLALLDYPQISAFFTENKLEMVRSMIECMAVIAISVGLLQAVEMFSGEHMEYFNTFYMMMIVFSTIGYGDVTVTTVQGRLLLIVLIGVGISYFVPMLEYVANLGVQHLRYARYETWLKRINHVIFCGRFRHNDLRMQLENLFAGKRSYYNTHVIILLPDQPSAEILLLLNAPKYRSAVTLLVGDPGNEGDLVRCNARGASGVFLFGSGASSSCFDDYGVARQAMAVHAHVPATPLYVMLHRARFTRSIMPKSARILEIERLNHSLLGLGCVLPGMVPFIANLVRVFDPVASVRLWEASDFADPGRGTLAVAKAFARIGSKQRDLYSYEALLSGAAQAVGRGTSAEDVAIVREEIASFDPMWCDLYEASLAQHIEVLVLPPSQCTRSFRSLATLLYKRGITTIGVVRSAVSPSHTGSRTASPRSGPSSPLLPHSHHGGGGGVSSPNVLFSTPSAFPGERIVELAPSGGLADVERVIVICDKKEDAQAALASLQPVEAEVEMEGFDGNETLRALKEHVVTRGVGLTVGDKKKNGSLAHHNLSPSPSHQALPSLLVRNTKTRATDVAIVAGEPVLAAAAAVADVSCSIEAAGSGAHSEVPFLVDALAVSNESIAMQSADDPLPSPLTQGEGSRFANVIAAMAVTRGAVDARSEGGKSSAPPTPQPAVSPTPVGITAMMPHGIRKLSADSGGAVPSSAATGQESGGGSTSPPRQPKTVTIVPPTTDAATAAVGDRERRDIGHVTHVPAICARSGGSPTLASEGESVPASDPASPALRHSVSLASMASDSSLSTDVRAKAAAIGAGLRRTSSGRGLGHAAEEMSRAIHFIADAHELRNHFVFVDLSAAHERQTWTKEAKTESQLAKAADFFDALRPARQHSPMNQIVLLAKEPSYEYLRMMWEDEMSGSLAIIQGCGLFLSDLQKCNINAAAAVVVFSAGDRCDDHADALTILVSKTIRQLAAEGREPTDPGIPVVVELDHTKYVPLVGNGGMGGDNEQSTDWIMDPSFLSGSVVCRHILDTALQETYFIPEVHQVVEQLLSGWGDALSVTSLEAQAAWQTYGDVIDYCLERRLLPLAIHRLHEDLTGAFRFIITNPPGAFPAVSTDIVYCLKIH